MCQLCVGCVGLISASWHVAHVWAPVVCHSGVRATRCGPWTPPPRVCWSLSVPPPPYSPLPPGSQCNGEPVVMTTLPPPSSHPSSDRLSAPPIPIVLGGGALVLPPHLSFPPLPQQPRLPSSSPPSASPSLHPSVLPTRGRGVSEPVSSPSLPPSCISRPSPGLREARVERVPMAGG